MTYDIVMITGSTARGAIRVQKTYLEQLLKLNDTGEFEAYEFGNPIPINLEADTIQYLPGINILDISMLNITQDFSKAVIGLWAFQQYRLNIDNTQPVETDWLNRLTIKYQNMLSDCLPQIKTLSDSDFLVTENMIDLVIHKHQDIDEEAYLNLLAKKVEEVNNAIKDSASTND